jgi:hypothetical protein
MEVSSCGQDEGRICPFRCGVCLLGEAAAAVDGNSLFLASDQSYVIYILYLGIVSLIWPFSF